MYDDDLEGQAFGAWQARATSHRPYRYEGTKMTTISKLEAWLAAATPDETERLARHAETSAAYLMHLARNYGQRTPNVRMAVRIEEFTTKLHPKRPDLPIVTCEDLAK